MAGFIMPTYTSSSSQLADLFTKALPLSGFRQLLSKMSLVDLHTPHLAGGCRNGEHASVEAGNAVVEEDAEVASGDMESVADVD